HQLQLRRCHPVRRCLRATSLGRTRRAGHRPDKRAQRGDRARRRVLGRLPRPGFQCGSAGPQIGQAPGAVEPLTLLVRRVTTDSVDAHELADVAARTFPLACPPSIPAENIATFIETNLSAARFAEYLNDTGRAILTATDGGRIIGYAPLIPD